MTTKTKTPIRSYFMALFNKRRTPVRVAKEDVPSARKEAREWWLVQAHSAADARKLCLTWPMSVFNAANDSRIVDHGKNRG